MRFLNSNIKGISHLCSVLAVVFFVTAASATAQNLQTFVSTSQTSVVAGTNVTYSIQVVNNTAADTTDTEVALTLPAGIVHAANNGSCVVATNTVTCPLNTIASGFSGQVTVTLHVNDDFVKLAGSGFVNFSATATSAENPPANTVVGTTPVTESADLKLSNSTTDTTPQAGEVFTYTIYVDNWGPSTARNVAIRDTLLNSDKVTVLSCAYSVSQGGGAITQFTCGTGDVVETQFGTDIGTFRTNFVRSLQVIPDDPNTPQDESGLVGRLRGSFRLQAKENIDVVTDARTFSDTPDSNPSDNQANSSVISVEAVADLDLSISSSGELQPDGTAALPYDLTSGDPFPDPAFNSSSIAVTAGRRVQYSYTVTNKGMSDAKNTQLTSRLPAAVRPVPGTLSIKFGGGAAAPGSCQFGTPGNPADSMTCALGNVDADVDSTPPGTTGFNVRTISFDVMVDTDASPGTLLVNNILLGSSVLDVDNSNNLGANLMVVSPLTGVSECSAGGPYTNVQCLNGTNTVGLNGFGYAQPGGPVTYQWTSTCPGASFNDATSASPQLTLTTTNPDKSPVSCQVGLTVQNAFAHSTCSGNVVVVDCSVDCLGAVGGSAQLDRCGVCQGNGNSCLGCSSVDTSSSVAQVTKSAVAIRSATLRAAAQLGDERQRHSARRIAVKSFLSTLASLSKIPTTVQNCTNNAFCVQSTNVTLLSTMSSGLGNSLTGLQSVVKKLSDKGLAKKFLKQGQNAQTAAKTALVKIPVTSSSCS